MIKPTPEQIKVKRALSAFQNAQKRVKSAKKKLREEKEIRDKRFNELDEALIAGYGEPLALIEIFPEIKEVDFDRLHAFLTDNVEDPLDLPPYESRD